MTPTPTTDSSVFAPPSYEDSSLADCVSILVCLSNRRFVVVRPDEPPRDLWPIRGGWQQLRQLTPGDQVIYKGACATVRAVDVYR